MTEQLGATTPRQGAAQRLVRRWRLVQWRTVAEEAELVEYPFGEHPRGTLVYGGDGWVTVQIVAANRPRFAVDDPLGGPVEEHTAAYATCLAYSGRYEVRDDRVVHKIEISLYPNWEGQEQVRLFDLSEDTLVLRTPQIQFKGTPVVNELRWTRAD
jgi:hypothetical protein